MGKLTRRINALLADLAVNRVLAAANRLVLVVHDGTGARRRIVAQVTRKAGDGGDDNDNAELAVLLSSANASVDNCPADVVVDRVLLAASGGDEELVLDVDEVLRVADGFAVGVLDTVLVEDAAAPVVAAADKLRPHRSLHPARLRLERC